MTAKYRIKIYKEKLAISQYHKIFIKLCHLDTINKG